MDFRRTRIAPTPSGFLHLGNALSFVLTAYLAHRSHAEIVLRIDDMDRDRVQPAYVQDIFDTLEFLQIPWQKGPRNSEEFETKFSQLHRLNLYNRALDELKAKNVVFACTCSRSQLAAAGKGGYSCTCRQRNIPLDREGVAWRLRTDDSRISVRNIDGKETFHQLPAAMREFVVRKKDGFPSYQLTSVVDDLFWDVDLVVRGEDLWDSTIAQLYLAKVMERDDFGKVCFYHHPLIMSAEGVKLSKTAGDVSVRFLRKEGRAAGEIFAMLSGLMKLNTTVDSWETLGELVYDL